MQTHDTGSDSFGSQMRVLMHLYVGDKLDDVRRSYFDHAGDDMGLGSFNSDLKVLKLNGYVNSSGTKITNKGVDMVEMYIKARANAARYQAGSLHFIQTIA